MRNRSFHHYALVRKCRSVRGVMAILATATVTTMMLFAFSDPQPRNLTYISRPAHTTVKQKALPASDFSLRGHDVSSDYPQEYGDVDKGKETTSSSGNWNAAIADDVDDADDYEAIDDTPEQPSRKAMGIHPSHRMYSDFSSFCFLGKQFYPIKQAVSTDDWKIIPKQLCEMSDIVWDSLSVKRRNAYQPQTGQMFNHCCGKLGGAKGYQVHYLRKYDTFRSSSKIDEEEYELQPIEPYTVSLDSFFPRTYLLWEELDCFTFFDIPFDDERNREKVWVRKPNSGMQGRGIQFITAQQAKENLRPKYQDANGRLCRKEILDGLEKELVQDYVQHPLLIDGRKFDIRVHVLVGTVRPLRIFIRKGYLRVALSKKDFATGSGEVTNTHVQIQREDYSGEDHIWNFKSLDYYLYYANYTQEMNYVDNVLMKRLKAIARTTILAAQHSGYMINDDVHRYQLFGFDFMLDEWLNPWLLEVNGRPGWSSSSKWKVQDMKDEAIDMVNTISALHKCCWATSGYDSNAKIGREEKYAFGSFELIYDEVNFMKSGDE